MPFLHICESEGTVYSVCIYILIVHMSTSITQPPLGRTNTTCPPPLLQSLCPGKSTRIFKTNRAKKELLKIVLTKISMVRYRTSAKRFCFLKDNGSGRVAYGKVGSLTREHDVFIFYFPGRKTGVSSRAPQLPDNGGCVLATAT
jgi:hypothetical protein